MIVRLGPSSASDMRRLLMRDPVVNLFLLGFLDAHPVDRVTWLGSFDGDLKGVALVVPGRLVVPCCEDPDDAAAIGAHLRRAHEPSMVVGPRAASDALWSAWTRGAVTPVRFYEQRLYVLRDAPQADAARGFRRAYATEWRQIADNAAAMEVADLGRDPRDEGTALHNRVVKDRIERGATWVIERAGTIVFQINVGTSTALGCQVGGTYVPPAWRGRGIATDGMRALSTALLADHPLITLHVNEANNAAVRAYERVGFQRSEAYRLITV